MLAQLIGITRHYPLPDGGTTEVLTGIDLEINEGATLAVKGPSGSGKSTLLNILGTLDKSSSGRVLLDGKDVATLDHDGIAGLRNRFVGFVFQQHFLLPQLTLLENVMLPVLKKDKAERESATIFAITLINKVGLLDHADKFPSQLSVGECQRVAVVRALINRPKILLADEPTGSLDRANALHLADLLNQLREDHRFAMVLVTHSEELAAMAEKSYLLESGKLRAL